MATTTESFDMKTTFWWYKAKDKPFYNVCFWTQIPGMIQGSSNQFRSFEKCISLPLTLLSEKPLISRNNILKKLLLLFENYIKN